MASSVIKVESVKEISAEKTDRSKLSLSWRSLLPFLPLAVLAADLHKLVKGI